MILSDIMQLPIFSSIYLVAGVSGIAKDVKKVAVLDYEIIDDVSSKVYPGDLLLTTFTPARGDMKMVENTIKALIKTHVVGIALKKVFFPSLPQSLIDLANQHGFPIFLFDEGVFFEDIITAVAIAIKERDQDQVIQRKIKLALTEPLNDSLSKSLFREVTPLSKKQGFICFSNNVIDPGVFSETVHHDTFRLYDQHIHIVSSDEKLSLNKTRHFLMMSNSVKFLTIGFSSIDDLATGFQRQLKESQYAYLEAQRTSVTRQSFEAMGLNRILAPIKDDQWTKDFYHDFMNPLLEYDHKYDQHLVDTFATYYENKENINKTANVLFTHPNTIRFRLKRGYSLYDEEVRHILPIVFQLRKLYL